MTSSFQYQGGTFAPIEQEDYVPSAIYNAQQQKESLTNYHTALRQNNQRGIEISGKRMEQLSKLSEKAGQFVGMYKEKRDARRKSEAIEWHMKNGLPQDQIDEYHRAREQVKGEYTTLVELTEKDPDMDAFTKERFVNLAPWKQILVMEQEVATRANTYQLAGDPTLDGALDPTQYNAALAVKNAEFLEQFGDINPALLEEHLFKKMRATQEAHAKTWTANRGKAMEENRDMTHNASATAMFQSESGGAVDAIDILFATNGGNKAEARDTYFDNRETDIANGLGSLAAIEAIGEEEIDGKKIKDHHAYKGRYNKLKQKLVDFQTDDFKDKKALKQIKASEEEEAVIDALPPLPQKQEVKDLLNGLKRRNPGQKFTALEAILKDSTLEATVLTSYREEAEKWADHDLLTEERLATFPWQIRREFADVAKMQTQSSKVNKSYLDAAEALVISQSATFPNGKARHPTAIILASRMQNVYMDRLKLFMEDGKLSLAQAQDFAFKATQAEFSKYEKSRRGWNIGLPEAKSVASRGATLLQTRLSQTEALDSQGLAAFTQEGLWGSKEQLEKDRKNIAKGNYPQWAKDVAKLYPEVNEIDVFNMYADTMKVKKAKNPVGDLLYNYKLNKGLKTEIENHENNPTALTAAIAFHQFDPKDRMNLFYTQDEQKMLQEATEEGVDTNFTAAAYDFLYSDPIMLKMFGLKQTNEFAPGGSRSRKNRVKPYDIDTPIKEAVTAIGDASLSLDTAITDIGNAAMNGILKSIRNSRELKRLDDAEKLANGWTRHPRRGWVPPKSTEEDLPLFDLTIEQEEMYDLIDYKFGNKQFD